jgi:hypothetical protein
LSLTSANAVEAQVDLYGGIHLKTAPLGMLAIAADLSIG